MGACCSKPVEEDSPEVIAERREQMLKTAEARQKQGENRGVKTQKMKTKLKTAQQQQSRKGGGGLNEGEKRRAEGVVADWNS